MSKTEAIYQTTMHFVKAMLDEGMISREEYKEMESVFVEKYKPVMGRLYSDIDLTYAA